MRYGRVLGLAAVAVAFGCTDGSKQTEPNGLEPGKPLFTAVSGAVFTSTNPAEDDPDLTTDHDLCKNATDDDPAINCNIYNSKDFVWLTGGPGPSSLADGTYFFAVLVPGGQGGGDDPNDGTLKNLSDPAGGDTWEHRVFSVSSGVITYPVSGYLGGHDFANGMIRLMPYDNTTNPGGEYTMAVCLVPGTIALTNPPGVTPSDCKYDNFKVREGEVTDFATVEVLKFYDANGNRQQDGGEPFIDGWLMTLNEIVIDATKPTPASWNFLDAGTYSVTEGIPTNGTWYISYKGLATGLLADNLLAAVAPLASSTAALRTINSISVIASATETRLFGNYCTVGSGGMTLGFWSNNNGKLILNANWTAWATLVNTGGPYAPSKLWVAKSSKNGTITTSQYFAPTTGTASNASQNFGSWLVGAQASNNGSALYMLSAQYAAMLLNIQYEGVNPGAIYPPGLPTYATIGDIMTAAAAVLNAGPPGNRTLQTQLIGLLNGLNNNGGVIAGTPGDCPTPFPE